MKRIKDLICYRAIGGAVQLAEPGFWDDSKKLLSSFVVGQQLEDDLVHVMGLLASPGGHGVWIIGNSGTGKTRTLQLLAATASDSEAPASLPSARLTEAAAGMAGNYKPLLIDLAGEEGPLREVVLYAMQQHFGECGVEMHWNSTAPDDNDRQLLEQALHAFESRFPERRYMLAVDGFTDFLDAKRRQDISADLRFLRDLSMMVKRAGLTLLLSTNSRLLTERRFASVVQHLDGKISCFNKVTITSEQLQAVAFRSCLQKTPQQWEYVLKHLQQFAPCFPPLQEHLEEYVQLFPLHPSIFEALKNGFDVGGRGVLVSISQQIDQSLEEMISTKCPGLIALDSFWPLLQGEISTSSNQTVKRLTARCRELCKTVRNGFASKEQRRAAVRIICALSMRQVLLRSEGPEAGFTAQELRDQLCLWPELIFPLDAGELLKYIESLMSDIMAMMEVSLLERDEETGRYHIITRKKTSYNKKITLEEISQKIKISRTTLYKIINNKGFVSPNTRSLVEDALIKYNYIPNFNARDLAHHKTYRIAYIGMAHHGSTFFSKLTQAGIHKALSELADNGLEVLSAITHVSMPEQQIDRIEEMLEKGIRDFIIVPCNPEVLAEEVKKLRAMGCNIIYLSRYVDEPHRVFVGVDYLKSGRLAAEMMSKIMPGGGKIAITTSDRLCDDLWVRQRYDGFVDFLSDRKDYQVLCLREDITDDASAGRVCQELLETYPDLNAIYDISYKSDLLARKLVQLHRGQDIKLIGFDLYDAVMPYIRSSVIDVAIGQSLSNQAYDAVKMMFYHSCYGMPIADGDYNSRLDVIVSSNIDCFDY